MLHQKDIVEMKADKANRNRLVVHHRPLAYPLGQTRFKKTYCSMEQLNEIALKSTQLSLEGQNHVMPSQSRKLTGCRLSPLEDFRKPKLFQQQLAVVP